MKNKKGFVFVLSIPIINAIAANTTGYLPHVFINPGAIRGIIIGIFSIYFLTTRLSNTRINIFILLFLFYYLILTLLSTKIDVSLDLYFKFYLGVIMFPIGYYYFNTQDKTKILMNSFFFALILYIINIAISNIFKLGTSDYLEDSFYFGAGRVNITKSMLLLVFFAPLTLSLSKSKATLSVFFVIGLLISFIGIKRSVLLSGISGFLVYSYLKRNKSNLIRGAMGLMLLFTIYIIVFPTYTDTFLNRFEAREERIEVTEESLDKEARYNELNQVLDTWVTGSIKHKLFGSELFNDRYFFNTTRMLHTDYMILLNGAGIIGLFLWLFLFYVIIREKNKYFKYLKKDDFFREMNSLFYMFLIAQLIMSVSSTIYAIDIRYIFFLYWGAMIGTMRTRVIELKRQIESSKVQTAI